MRFYGGNGLAWLAETPIGLVRSHVSMMDRLIAEESLLWALRMAVGGGWMDRNDRMRIVSEWERVAQVRPRFQTPQEQLEIVRSITIAMGGHVPRKT